MDELLTVGIKEHYKNYFEKSSLNKIISDMIMEIEGYSLWSLKESYKDEIKEKSRDIYIDDKLEDIIRFIEAKFNNGAHKRYVKYITKIVNLADRYMYDFFNKVDSEEDILIFSLMMLHPYRKYLDIKNIEVGNIDNENLSLDDVYYDMISDIFLRLNSYYEGDFGKLGMFWEDGNWLSRIFCLKIFKLGSLQYEIIELDMDKYRDSLDESFKNCEKIAKNFCLSVHIMKGVDFSKNAVDRSFEIAKRFFDLNFPNVYFKYFYCFSWMLFSGNSDFLPEKSRILDFASRFEIISERKFNQYALISIFGFRPDFDKFDESVDYFVCDIEARSSLQKKALENITSLGVAEGIMSY